MLVGYAVVIAYVVIFFHVSSNPRAARERALEGVLAVIASTWAGSSACRRALAIGVTFSAVTVQVLPFLSMGLGVNDFFVLASHASPSSARDLDDESDVEETMREGGVGDALQRHEFRGVSSGIHLASARGEMVRRTDGVRDCV